MHKLYLFLFLLALPFLAKSQSMDICGSAVPAGWVTTAIKSSYCAMNGYTGYIGRTITRIDLLPSGYVLDICGDNVPAGWVTLSVKPGYCATLGYNNYIGRTIKKVDGLPAGTVLNICGENAPPGWVTISVNGNCSKIGYTDYVGRTIKKIDGAAPGTVMTICGDNVPKGWVTTSVNGYCATIGYTNYIGRTIKKIDGMAPGTSIAICGDNVPDGWVTTSVDGYCAKIGYTDYIGRTIRKVEGMPAASKLEICGDNVPRGWITTAVKAGYCKTLGYNNYIGRSIIKIEGMPIGSIVITCGDPAPAEWVQTQVTGQCAKIGYTSYTGAVIQKISGMVGQSITFNPLPALGYGSPDYTPSVSASSGLPVSLISSNPAVATIVNGKIRVTGTGVTYITASQAGNFAYTAAASVTQVLTVNKAAQVITFPPVAAKTLNTADFSPGASVNSNLPLTFTSSNTAVATIVNGKIHINAAGTTNITASQNGNDYFNPAAPVTQQLTVAKNNQSITFAAIAAKTTGTADFAPGATASSGLAVSYKSSNAAVATIVSGKIRITGAGTSVITASQPGNNIFNAATDVSQTLTVKTTQKITFNAIAAKTFGSPDFSAGAKSSSGLLVSYASSNAKVATIVEGKIRITGVGTATISASQAGSAIYLPATQVAQVLTVSKGTQLITFKTITAKTVNTADFDPGATATSGLKVAYTSSNAAVATIVSGKIHLAGVGTTTITAKQPGNSLFNAAADVVQSLTVGKASQTISFKAIPNKPFGTADFAPGATASSALVVSYTSSNTQVAAIVNGKIRILKTGKTTITASQAGNAFFSNATSVSQQLTVIKGEQKITFKTIAEKKVNAADFDPGATVSSGLPIAYKSSNTAVATILNGKILILKDGTATITASQNGNTNFNPATSVSQLLTVSKLSQTITFKAIAAKKAGAADFDPGATASSGLKITYTSSNTAVATIVNGKIHIIKAGTTKITAAQPGNATYAAATAITQTLTVTNSTGNYETPPPADSLYTEQPIDETSDGEDKEENAVEFEQKISTIENNPSLDFNAYPNPADTQLTIEIPFADPTETTWIRLFHITGRMEKEIQTKTQTITVNIGHLREGIYIVRVTQGKQTQAKQILIKH